MERRRLAWGFSLPLAVAGWLTAHALAFRLVGSEHGHGSDVHGYLDYVEAVAVFAVIVALAGLVAAGMRRARGRRPPLLLFGAVPLVGFAVQELVEHGVHAGGSPLGAALEPTFLVGLLLQLPFALAALLVARALLALGGAIRRLLGATPRLALPGLAPAPVGIPELPRIAALALGYGERGPPPLAR